MAVASMMAQMDVQVVHLAAIDAGAQFRIGLVWQAQVDAVRTRQRTIEFRCSRCAREHAYTEWLAPIMSRHHPRGQRLRYRFGVARASKATHADRHARIDQFGGLCRRHDLAGEARVADTLVHGGDVSCVAI
jgi:hypothetical protein